MVIKLPVPHEEHDGRETAGGAYWCVMTLLTTASTTPLLLDTEPQPLQQPL